MKKYVVIGNPIEHSLSPKLHNFWIKSNSIKAIYSKEKVLKNNLKHIVDKLRNKKLYGINVTVPHKTEIIPYVDELTNEAQHTQSVNTIFERNGKIIGHNTDIAGFDLSLRHAKLNLKNKKVLILGAGGVSPSLIYALKNHETQEIAISNRTYSKAEEIKNKFNEVKIIEWEEFYDFDLIINATSLGLNFKDKIKIDHKKLKPNKTFYDVIYNPEETNFLKEAKINNHKTQNGMMMFIYQAHQAFTIWHNIMPKIDNQLIELLINE